MKYFIIIIVGTLYSNMTVGQTMSFSKAGIMGGSNFLIDSIIKLNYRLSKDSLLFNRIDSNTVSYIKNGFKLLSKYLSPNINNSIEYFYLYNSTGRDLRIRREDKRIVAIELASVRDNRYRPMNYFMHFKEVYEIDDLVLPTQAMLIIKSTLSNIKGETKAVARIKVKISEDRFIMSSPFETYINENSFSMNYVYEKDYNQSAKPYLDLLNQ